MVEGVDGLMGCDMGGCQNYGPLFSIPIIIRHLISRVPQRGIIILTTTHRIMTGPRKLKTNPKVEASFPSLKFRGIG